jgi:sugar transferase EpsL
MYFAAGKRLFDLCIAVPSLVVLFPFIAVIAALVRLTLGSPVFFRQLRPGLNGQPFNLIKFRTMSEARGARGDLLPDSQRLTSLGRFLRTTSLDELPELFNVIKGNMSLVGPRPLLMEYLERYNAQQAKRHDVKPGITGLAQINGRNAITWEQRFALDVQYVEKSSLWLDLRILLLTVIKVMKREGISAQGHSTMPYFLGSRSGGDERR